MFLFVEKIPMITNEYGEKGEHCEGKSNPQAGITWIPSSWISLDIIQDYLN